MIVDTITTALHRDGIVVIPGLWPEQVDAIWEFVRKCPRWGGHVKREGRPYVGQPISCWGMHDLMMAPLFWEWALTFTTLAEEYLGQEPLLYSMNAFESLPSEMPAHPGIEVFHRDYDDVKFLALFIYLTDVRPDDGSHLYQCGTHEGKDSTRTVEICGPRGTAFLADTRGFHMGVRPTSGPRRMAWARWGVSDPPASYVRDQLQPLSRDYLGHRYPNDPAMQRVVKLVAA